jgi:hypothetical protein
MIGSDWKYILVRRLGLFLEASHYRDMKGVVSEPSDEPPATQDERSLGIVTIEVGLAPLKPAEFVVIKIQQQAAGDLTLR